MVQIWSRIVSLSSVGSRGDSGQECPPKKLTGKIPIPPCSFAGPGDGAQTGTEAGATKTIESTMSEDFPSSLEFPQLEDQKEILEAEKHSAVRASRLAIQAVTLASHAFCACSVPDSQLSTRVMSRRC